MPDGDASPDAFVISAGRTRTWRLAGAPLAQRAAVPLDDAPHQRQPDARPLELVQRMQAREHLEQLAGVVHVEPHAVVLDVADRFAGSPRQPISIRGSAFGRRTSPRSPAGSGTPAGSASRRPNVGQRQEVDPHPAQVHRPAEALPTRCVTARFSGQATAHQLAPARARERQQVVDDWPSPRVAPDDSSRRSRSGSSPRRSCPSAGP